ncbi:DUF485 domain-containing protein [Streptomyces gilvifuscus]|uniref:DUF485 domain-containing protein n=1 Tax=Streptomyces gilvifuscus TaxID=1550617 RepID=A0ABT5G5M4_9ACTN|nr:DUF485 domain-containing protein [Streptomyces gilvifuscus]MDC2960144.1 DUF485 domain-containing protein [Streptomyces gilvifuscus]
MSRNHEGFEPPPRISAATADEPQRRAISDNPEFQALKRAQRRSGLAMTVIGVGGFLVYVLLSSFTPGLLNSSLSGHLTLGLALGLGQFVLMAVIARRYVVHMRTRVDPVARGFRTQLHRPTAEGPGRTAQHPSVPRQRAGEYRTW